MRLGAGGGGGELSHGKEMGGGGKEKMPVAKVP